MLDGTDISARDVALVGAGASGMSVMFFAGKRLNQPIAWRGPIVMCTDAEVRQTYEDCRRGAFPPVRAPWDYKRIAADPRRKT